MLNRFFCLIGMHDWKYLYLTRRVCRHCPRRQFLGYRNKRSNRTKWFKEE